MSRTHERTLCSRGAGRHRDADTGITNTGFANTGFTNTAWTTGGFFDTSPTAAPPW